MQKTFTSTLRGACLYLLALCLLVLLAACGGTTTTTSTSTPTTTTSTSTPTTAPASTGNSVSLANFAFSPAVVTVKVGTQVTWTNHDTVTHTVTADKGAFNSGPLAPGSTFRFSFTQAGTYSYHCNIHPSMMASIVVQ